ncbi:MAG: ACP S-malonyltransferase [Aggregatilineales bacterium]
MPSPDWSTIALVFPGQSSQQVGMGADLVRDYPGAAAVFAEADQVLGEPFTKLCFEGPAEVLDETLNTQPALYVMGVALVRTLESKAGTIRPIGVAGHSVGELTALAAAGALSFADGLRLVRERARAMRDAGAIQPGGMAALLGPTIGEAEALCAQASAETGKPVVVANDNCPGQVVISGDSAALERALQLASERGVKRAVKLAVSIAAHSPLMTSAAERFRAALAATPFTEPRYPVISNATTESLREPDEIRAALGGQLTSPVHWTGCVRTLRTLGAQTFLELGPKDVLTGLLKRIDRSATGLPLNSAATIAAFISAAK